MKVQTERWIAISVIVMSLILIAMLAMVLGKFSVATSERRIKARFTAVTGININSPVKYAGAPVGRVYAIRVLPRNKQVQDAAGIYCIETELLVSPSLELGNDVTVSIKQDGLLGSKFIALTPGTLDAQPLSGDVVLKGENPVELTDLAGPAQELIRQLQPVAGNLSKISSAMEQTLPTLMTQMDLLLGNGNRIMESASTPEGREQIKQLLANLRVVSDNLKVVTTHAKGITATLGERPWKLIWGGEPNKLPSEEEILKSNKPIPVRSLDDKQGAEFKAEKPKAGRSNEKTR